MEQKVIKLNPAFLKLSKSNSKPQPKTKKSKRQLQSLGEHKLKKKLMSRIHDFQMRAEQDESDVKTNDIEDEIQVFDTEFDKSIDFLKELTEKNKKKQTLKNREDSTPKPIMVNVDNITKETSKPLEHESTSKKTNTFSPITMTNEKLAHNQTIKIKPPPPYTCLKNSASMKPTYRQWMTRNNKTTHEPSINIHVDPHVKAENINSSAKLDESKPTIQTVPSIRRQKLDEIKSQFHTKQRLPRKLRRKKMTTVKHKLGKSGRKVCVLIKNHQTRKQIQREYSALKQKKISEVRSYLKKHNLLKGASIAPNDVLKAIYEQAILAGDVNNNSSETLIHNYNLDQSKQSF
jgi:hypothetical protein